MTVRAPRGSKFDLCHFTFLSAEILYIGVFGVAEHDSGLRFDPRGTPGAPWGWVPQGKGAMGSKSELRHFLFLKAEIIHIGVFGVAEHESELRFGPRGTCRAP